MKVAVYGTLKKGGRLSNAMSNVEFLGAETLSHFQMFNLGWFPGIKRSRNFMDTIKVEVYETNEDHLARLDVIEGVPHLYTRSTTFLEDGSECFIYTYNRETSDIDQIKSGDFSV